MTGMERREERQGGRKWEEKKLKRTLAEIIKKVAK